MYKKITLTTKRLKMTTKRCKMILKGCKTNAKQSTKDYDWKKSLNKQNNNNKTNKHNTTSTGQEAIIKGHSITSKRFNKFKWKQNYTRQLYCKPRLNSDLLMYVKLKTRVFSHKSQPFHTWLNHHGNLCWGISWLGAGNVPNSV